MPGTEGLQQGGFSEAVFERTRMRGARPAESMGADLRAERAANAKPPSLPPAWRVQRKESRAAWLTSVGRGEGRGRHTEGESLGLSTYRPLSVRPGLGRHDAVPLWPARLAGGRR